jgi:bacterioferritin
MTKGMICLPCEKDAGYCSGMETGTVNDYNNWANECSKNADSVSKKLFETLVEDKECHFNQYDDEMENLKKFGDNYLALQSIERSKNLGAGRPAAE